MHRDESRSHLVLPGTGVRIPVPDDPEGKDEALMDAIEANPELRARDGRVAARRAAGDRDAIPAEKLYRELGIPPPERTRRVDTRLHEITAEVDFLPALAELWAEESPVARATWHLEWWELMSRLKELEAAYRGEAMTARQRLGYRILRLKLRRALPLFERLALPLPTVPLDDEVYSSPS